LDLDNDQPIAEGRVAKPIPFVQANPRWSLKNASVSSDFNERRSCNDSYEGQESEKKEGAEYIGSVMGKKI
jgi:hypothetical protein